MGEEFEAGICGGNNYWWINNNMMMNSATTRSVLPLMMSSSPCSVLTANSDLSSGRGGGMIGFSTWQTDTVDLKSHISTTAAASCSDISLGFLDATTTKPLFQNHHHHQNREAAGADNHNRYRSGSILMDSSLDMIMGWNHSLSGNSSIQSKDRKREMCMKNKDLCGGNFSACSPVPVFSSYSPYGYPSNSSSSTLIQSLYDIPQALAQSLFTNPPPPQPSSMPYSSSTTNYGALSNSNDQFTATTTSSSSSSSWSRPSHNNNNNDDDNNANNDPLLRSNGGGLHFSNCTPFWNASDETPHVFAPSLISEKPNFTSFPMPKDKREEASDTTKKSSCEPAIKKQRIETPSPLPTFKVRKEKLGDRITALQQLVSPFGKTDTASVLHEAIEYIKFLHDQVSVLSTPYMKNGVPIQHCQEGCAVNESSERPKQDLRSRGLCLVPISSTLPVTNETPVDFWTPSFGGTLIR